MSYIDVNYTALLREKLEQLNVLVQEDVVHFSFNLNESKNYFTPYIGSMMLALFVLIFIIAFITRRKHSVVVQLAKPDTDSHVHEYLLLVKTSLRIGAGITNGGRVTVKLLGSFCDSQCYTLSQQYMRQSILHRAHTDIFALYTPMDIGDVNGIHFTLYNFGENSFASWRPSFVDVIKSRTRERWGINITRQLKCSRLVSRTYHLVKGTRERRSLWKLVLLYHQWAAFFFNPQRFGAYSSLAHILFFFFSQSSLLMCSLSAFIMGFKFLGKKASGELIDRYFTDIFPFVVLSILSVAAALQMFEMLLHNARPSPSLLRVQQWRGLWVNDHLPDLMHCNVTHTWDRPPSTFSRFEGQFASQMSLSSLGSSSLSSRLSLVSENEWSDDVDVAASPEVEKARSHMHVQAKVSKDASIVMLRQCMRTARVSYGLKSLPSDMHQLMPSWGLLLGQAELIYTPQRTVAGSTMAKLTAPLPRAACQFCLWIKHLNVRGEDLLTYTLSLTHHMRRSLQAIKMSMDPRLTAKVMTICIHQWLSSVSVRMLKEVVARVEKEGLSTTGLAFLLKGFYRTESNLWFAEEGHKQGPMAGKRKGDKSHMVSNLYFSVLRSLTGLWKASHGDKGILRKPDEIFPVKRRRSRIHFNENVRKKSIHKVADILLMMEAGKTADAAIDSLTGAMGNINMSAAVDGETGHLAARAAGRRDQGGVDDVDTNASSNLTQVVRAGRRRRGRVRFAHDVDRREAGTSQIDSGRRPSHGKEEKEETRVASQGSAIFGPGRPGPAMPLTATEGALYTSSSEDESNNAVTPATPQADCDRTNNAAPQTADPASPGDEPPLQAATSQTMSQRFSRHVKKKLKKMKATRPATLMKLVEDFESHANVVQLEVSAPFAPPGAACVCCCARPLCQTYAVMFSQLREVAMRVALELATECVLHKHVDDKVDFALLKRQQKVVQLGVLHYIVRRADLLAGLGKPEDKDALVRIRKEMAALEKDVSNTDLFTSPEDLDFSDNNPDPEDYRVRGTSPYSGFRFGKRKSHHGLIQEWRTAPYPFKPTLLPPLRLRWGDETPAPADSLAHPSLADINAWHVQPAAESDVDLGVSASKITAGLNLDQLKAKKVALLGLSDDVGDPKRSHSEDSTAQGGDTNDNMAQGGDTNDNMAQGGDTNDNMAQGGDTNDNMAQGGDTNDNMAQGGDTNDNMAQGGDTNDNMAQGGDTNDNMAQGGDTNDNMAQRGSNDNMAQRGDTNGQRKSPSYDDSTKLRDDRDESTSASGRAPLGHSTPSVSHRSMSEATGSPSQSDHRSRNQNQSLSGEGRPVSQGGNQNQSQSEDMSYYNPDEDEHDDEVDDVVEPESNVDGGGQPAGRQAVDIVRTVVRQSQAELRLEARWVVGLRETLGSVVAFARYDVLDELDDPIKIAVRHFTHAVLVLLFEALLPKDEEEQFVVTPDDIRQRRKRVSSRRTPGLFDLTECNHPGYDLNFLDFVVVKLCERWEMAKVEYQHASTLMFLARCLTMANLDTDVMEVLDDVLIERRGVAPGGLALDKLTHVHETQKAVSVVVKEVMAATLAYVVPETLRAVKDVSGWLRDEEERVTYVVEKVSILEHQVRHKLSRRILQAASHQVQDQLCLFTQRQENIDRRQARMTNKLRKLMPMKYYYLGISSKDLAPIKKDLNHIRRLALTVHRISAYQMARSVSKYTRRTYRLEDLKVQSAISSLTERHNQELEYSPRQLADVEWVVTGQMDKPVPSAFVPFALVVMTLGIPVNLLLVTVLGASFTPINVGLWFAMHVICVLITVVVSEPIKCLWYVPFGWEQPTNVISSF